MVANDPAWVRLGDLLQSRRKSLARAVNADWRFRRRFVDDHLLDYRTTSDLERGDRDNYDARTYARIERAYMLKEGAIESFLASETEALEEQPIVEVSESRAPLAGEELAVERVAVTQDFEVVLAAVRSQYEQMTDEERDAARRQMIEILNEIDDSSDQTPS
ncbi:hypothetical protein [Nonomuraea helvata]|uniref:DNA-binding protein n=1 Tax=Nonomuraea helvata TaxID=37484 RepID=A0ABV5SHY7_9ACTN